MSTLIVKNLDAPTGESIVAPDLTLPQGAVIQVVEGRLTTRQGNSTETFASVGLSASITPSSTTSKILVTVSVNSISCSTGSGVHLRLKRGSTFPISNTSGGTIDTDDGFFAGGGAITDSNRQRASGTISFLDSPNTTAEITYDVEMRCTDSGATSYINGLDITVGNGSVSTITLMEIAG